MFRTRPMGDTLFSLLIVLFGLFIAYEATGMSIGTARRIGPGFFPLGLGAIIVVLGIGTLFEPAGESRSADGFNLRGLVCVSLALLAFAGLVERLGLFPAIAALVILTSLGDRRLHPLTVIATTLALCAVGYFLFIWALHLPLEPFVLPFAAAR